MLGHLVGYVKFHGRPFLGKNLQQKPLVLRVFFGPFWGYVGPMLGHVGAMLGPWWAYVGPMLGLCWSMIALRGRVGAMLSQC